ncbi:MAG: tail fiber domain-containing protein, partial [Alphaproteobacteria bacterium]|nr:tail fiber domain-containing protein [Alphaproteobacteria bacterium]
DNGTVAGNTPFTYNTMNTDLFMGPYNSATDTYSGSAAPSIHLHNGFIDGDGLVDYTTGGAQINLSSTSSTGGALVQLTTGCSVLSNPACAPVLNVIRGDINVASGMIYAQQVTSTLSGSDIRFKTDIHPMKNALADLMKLKPVTFVYKSNGRPSMGVIAQDLEKVYPQLVVKNDKGMRYVAYDGLIGPLIESVQELKHQNDVLREQLQEQSEEIKRMRSE